MNNMSDQSHLEMYGTIVDGSHGLFNVAVDKSDTVVVCTIGGRLRKNKTNLLIGDRVRIKVSPYDLSKGFIASRV